MGVFNPPTPTPGFVAPVPVNRDYIRLGGRLLTVESRLSDTPEVAIIPASVNVTAGKQVQFVVSPSGTATWSIMPNPVFGSQGQLSSGGLFTAPSSISTLISQGLQAVTPAGKIAYATITLMPIKVGITPSTGNLLAGGPGIQLTASLNDSSLSPTFSWSATAGSISGSGSVVTYFPPPFRTTVTVTVTHTPSGASGQANFNVN
jgi:hypothetical protein